MEGGGKGKEEGGKGKGKERENEKRIAKEGWVKRRGKKMGKKGRG